MAWIALEGMRFHAYHGVYDAEKLLGGEYTVDVYVRTGTAKAALSDSLEATVNYETIFQIVRIEMDQPRHLIETVVANIVARMKHQFGSMEALRVRVRKHHPPLGGRLDAAFVEEILEFVNDCPRCKKKFITYGDDCWERFPNLHPATRETLTRQFGPRCLCDDCLKFYSG